MDLGLTGKTTLLVNAASPVSTAIAQELASAGAHLVLADSDIASIERTARQLGGEVLAVDADTATEDGVKRAVAAARERWSAIDIAIADGLCRNGERASLAAVQPTLLWRSYDRQVMSLAYLIRELAQDMQQRGWGRFLGVTCCAAKSPLPGNDYLIADEVAPQLVGLAKGIAGTALARHGVTINTVLVGDMEGHRHGLADSPSLNPLKRPAQPAEAAAVAAFLVSACASFINGSAVPVDGGLSRALF